MASMIELFLMIKRDLAQITGRNNNQSLASLHAFYTKARVLTISVAVIFALTCVFCLIFFKVSDYCNGQLQNNKKRTIYGYVTGTVFLIDSIGLLYWTFRLIHMLKSDFKNSLKSERNLLNCLFVLSRLVT